MRNAFVNTLTKMIKNDQNIILITGDLGYGALTNIWKENPKQFINAGISEQNMTSVAAGLAKEGKTVFTYSIANFPTLRCLEQIRNDICYHNENVKIVSIGAGMAYGSAGMSHHATEVLAIIRALPNIVFFSPGDSVEAEKVTEAAYNTQGPCCILLGKGGEPNIHKRIENFRVGKAINILEGSRVSVFATGGILSEAYKAVNRLNDEKISTALYSFPTIKPIDKETIEDCAKTAEIIITVEEGNILGGFGGAVAEVLAEMPIKKAVLKRIGLHDCYPSVVGDQAYLRNFYGISAEQIVYSVCELLDTKA